MKACTHCGNPILEPYAYVLGADNSYYCEECILNIAEDLRKNWRGPIYEAFLQAMNQHIEDIPADAGCDVSAMPDTWEERK